MTPLRQQLLDCMQVRHFSIRTQQAYVRWVYDLAKQTHCSPDALQDSDLKQYLWSLTLERHLSSSSCAQAFHALNFFYGQVLGRTFSEQLAVIFNRTFGLSCILHALFVLDCMLL